MVTSNCNRLEKESIQIRNNKRRAHPVQTSPAKTENEIKLLKIVQSRHRKHVMFNIQGYEYRWFKSFDRWNSHVILVCDFNAESQFQAMSNWQFSN